MNRRINPSTHASQARLTDGEARFSTAPGGAEGSSPEQALFRLDVLRSLRRHWRLALGFALAGVLLAIVYTVRNWSMYTAESFVYIQPTPSAVLEGAAPMHWPYNYDPATYDSYLQQQLLSMTRPDVLIDALHKLGSGEWQRSGESDASAAARLKGAIEVERVGTSYQVGITAHAPTADAAAELANAVAASYIDNTSHEQRAGDRDRLAMLREERSRVKKELDDDRAEQASLNAQLGVAAIGPVTPEHYDDDIARIHDALMKARTDHDEAAARLTALTSGQGPDSAALNAEADQKIESDPGLSSLKQTLLSRRAALISQMANLTPSHPLYKQDQEELQKINASLESATGEMRAKAASRIEAQLRTDLDRTAGLEERLNGELAQMTSAAVGATPKLQRLSDLSNDITRLQTRYDAVDEQLQNQTLEDEAPGLAHLAEAAVPPLHPSVIGVIRNALLLLFGLMGMGAAAAVIAHKLDPRIYVAADVEQLLGYAPMAQLPDFDEVSAEVAEEHLLRLATAMEYAGRDDKLKTCVMTGAGPGVGATTVAMHVKVLLSLLAREREGAAAADASSLDRLSASASSLMLSEITFEQGPFAARLMQRTEHLAQPVRQSMQLTDTAPLTVSAEAEYVARQADCVILVIESGKTTREQLRAAAKILERMQAGAVGFVLNRVSLKNADKSFRIAVSEVEEHLRAKEQASARAAEAAPSALPETPRVSLMREPPALTDKSVMQTFPGPENPNRSSPAQRTTAEPGAMTEIPEQARGGPLPETQAPSSSRGMGPTQTTARLTASPQRQPIVTPIPHQMPVIQGGAEGEAGPGAVPAEAADRARRRKPASVATSVATSKPEPAPAEAVTMQDARIDWAHTVTLEPAAEPEPVTAEAVSAHEAEAVPSPAEAVETIAEPEPAAVPVAHEPDLEPVAAAAEPEPVMAEAVATHEAEAVATHEAEAVPSPAEAVEAIAEPEPIRAETVAAHAAEPLHEDFTVPDASAATETTPAEALAAPEAIAQAPERPPVEEPEPAPIESTAEPPVQVAGEATDDAAAQALDDPPRLFAKEPARAGISHVPAAPVEAAPAVADAAAETWSQRAATAGIAAAPDRNQPPMTETRQEEETLPPEPTGLSGLRGTLFSLGIKELAPKKRPAQKGKARGKIAAGAKAEAALAASGDSDSDRTHAVGAMKPLPSHEPAHAAVERAVTHGAVPRWVTAEPEFLPPRLELAENDEASRTKMLPFDDDFDDIQILPSRRGQYRR